MSLKRDDFVPVLEELRESVTSNYVFATKHGRLRRNNLYSEISRIANKAGIKEIGLQTLREQVSGLSPETLVTGFGETPSGTRRFPYPI